MGHPREEANVSLLSKYLPRHQFAERHVTVVAGTAAAIHAVLARLEPRDDRFIAGLIALRELPGRLTDRRVGPARFGLQTFTLLERSASETVYGLVGRFWRLDFGLVPVDDGAAFVRFDTPGIAKLAMSFETEALPDGRTRLTTRTRIHAPDRATRLKLLAYWIAIRPASGLIRRRILRLVKRQVEAARAEAEDRPGQPSTRASASAM